MYIQFDREDPENLAGFTFNNSEEDQEQLTDFLSWLDTLNLTYNKLKIKVPASSEKMTCIIINKEVKQIKQVKQPVKQPVEEVTNNVEKVENIVLSNDVVNTNDDSDSETESETDIKTRKTTKKVTKK